uniref:Uncharacterized protein n=1 Tax=Macaca fascicularis TaxID=9541 RepID=Q2PFT3_MACFA|nr:hypothetical protein [Macaca fascicularis]
MTMERVFLFPYIMEAGVSFSKLLQIVENTTFCDIIVHFSKSRQNSSW